MKPDANFEVDEVVPILRPYCTEAEWAQIDHPVSRDRARQDAEDLAFSFLHFGLLRIREGWWDRFCLVQAPEEKETCKRMIDAINHARGLAEHERGAAIEKAHRERYRQATQVEADRRALDRWR